MDHPLPVQLEGNQLLRFSAEENELNLSETLSDELIEAADGKKLKGFDFLAYSGGAIRQKFTPLPIYVDLESMSIERDGIPALMDHNSEKRVGHVVSTNNNGKRLKVKGLISAVTESADEVIQSDGNGFRWQVSIGAKPKKFVPVAKGRTARVNGRVIHGPAYIAMGAVLREVSFVGLGADAGTHSIIAKEVQGTNMDFDEFIIKAGFVKDDLSPEQLNILEAAFKAETAPEPTPTPSPAPTPVISAAEGAPDFSEVIETINASTQELTVARRNFQIEQRLKDHPDLIEAACSEQWSDSRIDTEIKLKQREAELETIQASSVVGGGFAIHANSGEGGTQNAITAALCMELGMPGDNMINAAHGYEDASPFGNLVSINCSEQEVEYAERNLSGLGLKQLVLECARAKGFTGLNLTTDGIRMALDDTIKASSQSPFSYVNLPTAFTTVLQRIVIANYRKWPTVWNQFVTTASHRDFREVDYVRFGGLNMWTKVAKDGKLTMGQYEGEETFKNKLETYAQINSISRQDMINDDLGVFNRYGQEMAKWGSLAPEVVFNRLLNAGLDYDGNAFFSTGNTTTFDNLITSNPLGLDGLDAMYDLVSNRQDPVQLGHQKNSPQGNSFAEFINTEMTTLLFHTSQNRFITNLLSQATLHHEDDSTATSGSLKSTANFHFGRYRLVQSPYIGNTAWGGPSASTSSWYGFADPSMISGIEFAFLNGKQTPTMEAFKQLEGDLLGVSIRGWFDFGAAMRDRAAIVKNTA